MDTIQRRDCVFVFFPWWCLRRLRRDLRLLLFLLLLRLRRRLPPPMESKSGTEVAASTGAGLYVIVYSIQRFFPKSIQDPASTQKTHLRIIGRSKSVQPGRIVPFHSSRHHYNDRAKNLVIHSFQTQETTTWP